MQIKIPAHASPTLYVFTLQGNLRHKSSSFAGDMHTAYTPYTQHAQMHKFEISLDLCAQCSASGSANMHDEQHTFNILSISDVTFSLLE